MSYTYTAREKKAETDIDAFLRKINGAKATNVLQELRDMAKAA